MNLFIHNFLLIFELKMTVNIFKPLNFSYIIYIVSYKKAHLSKSISHHLPIILSGARILLKFKKRLEFGRRAVRCPDIG